MGTFAGNLLGPTLHGSQVKSSACSAENLAPSVGEPGKGKMQNDGSDTSLITSEPLRAYKLKRKATLARETVNGKRNEHKIKMKDYPFPV